jgi:hypothetical protein
MCWHSKKVQIQCCCLHHTAWIGHTLKTLLLLCLLGLKHNGHIPSILISHNLLVRNSTASCFFFDSKEQKNKNIQKKKQKCGALGSKKPNTKIDSSQPAGCWSRARLTKDC